MRVVNNVLHNTLAQVSARARFTPFTWSSMSCAWPHLVPFRVFLLSILLLPEPWAEPLPPCGRHRGNMPLALRHLRSVWPLGRKHPLTQLRASALTPNLTRNLGAKIEGQKYEIQTPQRDLQTTRDSLNSWDEVNLTSVQGDFVDERVATSTSSVSRITEPAISHLPQPGGGTRAVPTKGALNARSSINIDCRSQYATIEHLENSSDSTQFFYSDDFFYQQEVQKLQWQPLSMEDSTRQKQRQLLLTSGFNQQNSEVRKLAAKAQSLTLRNIPEPPCYG